MSIERDILWPDCPRPRVAARLLTPTSVALRTESMFVRGRLLMAQSLSMTLALMTPEPMRFTSGRNVGGPPSLSLSDSRITNSNYGLVTFNTTVDARRVSMNTLSGAGFYQASGSSRIQDCVVANATKNWSIYAAGERCDVFRTKVLHSRFGIALSSNTGTIVNTAISGGDYGLYFESAQMPTTRSFTRRPQQSEFALSSITTET